MSELAIQLDNGVMMAESRHIPGLFALGRLALTEDPAPNQRISGDKLQKLAEVCVLQTQNFAVVSTVDGKVVAGLCALVHDQMVYERKQASVVQFYTTVPGEGIKLIRMFLEWARSKRQVKSIVFTLETGADPRIGKMLRRLGLTSEMPIFMEWR